eukprot:scaffold15163_cov37-Phaeocystis_antarctica.AAC.1
MVSALGGIEGAERRPSPLHLVTARRSLAVGSDVARHQGAPEPDAWRPGGGEPHLLAAHLGVGLALHDGRDHRGPHAAPRRGAAQPSRGGHGGDRLALALDRAGHRLGRGAAGRPLDRRVGRHRGRPLRLLALQHHRPRRCARTAAVLLLAAGDGTQHEP